MRRAVIDQVGAIDERYFYFWEETEWCIRIGRAGWKVMHVPQAKMWHKGVTVDHHPKPSVTYYATRNRLLTMAKHRAPAGVRLRAWAQMGRTLTSWSVKPRWRHMRAHRDALWHGMVDYLRGRWGPMPSGEAHAGRPVMNILFLSRWFPYPTDNGVEAAHFQPGARSGYATCGYPFELCRPAGAQPDRTRAVRRSALRSKPSRGDRLIPAAGARWLGIF